MKRPFWEFLAEAFALGCVILGFLAIAAGVWGVENGR